MNKQNMVNHTTEYYSATKWSKVPICYNVDESWKYYAKGKKPITKDHRLYDSIPMKVQNTKIYIDILIVAEGWMGRMWGRGWWLKGTRFLSQVMKMLLN